jgi:N-acyl-D-amino-acid deacylase
VNDRTTPGNAPGEKTFDLLVRGGTVIDGTRAPRFDADVGVRDGRIVFIGDAGDARAARTIDARGRIVAPGFIDCHTHDDLYLLAHPSMTPKISQGVTTVVTGNCGVSAAPVPGAIPNPIPAPLDLVLSDDQPRFRTFGAFLQALRDAPPATHVAALVGHTTLRAATMDRCDRPATRDEIAAMAALVDASLAAGAIGCSSGLYYEGARAAPTEEVIAAFAPLATRGGVYCAHMRDEGDHVLAAMEETFRIGAELGVTAVISHHKVAGLPNHGRTTETLPLFAQRAARQKVCLDCYPYDASSTVLTEDRAEISARVLVASSRPLPQYDGRDLDEVAAEMGVSRAQAIERLRPASGVYFMMAEADVQRVLAFEPTMIGSDGIPVGGNPHPRLWGTFPRVLGRYSRDLGLFPLETAVHKMTGLTARNFGLTDRGVVAVGAHADLTVFDAATVIDLANFERSTVPARGIDAVIVAGVPVWREGAWTGARPGTVLSAAGH